MIGRDISHFRVVDELGAGGMGVAYRAVALLLERSVALKVFLPAADAAGAGRREAKAASPLNHPCIVTIHEMGCEGTLNHAALAGVEAAVRYLASWGEGDSLRARVVSAMAAVSEHEHALARDYAERVGISLYDTHEDVERLVEGVAEIAATATAAAGSP